MKKTFLLLTSFLLFVTGSVRAQITLDYANDTLAFGETNFHCVDIGENESKYVIVNRNTNSFSLYNMDMTAFMSNIVIPFTDSIKNGFVISYISRTLFDCDSTNIEYVYQSPYQGRKPFRILRTDGTVLLEVDSARGPYCFGCGGGGLVIQPIKKTSAGTKLFLDILNPSGLGVQVYSLCGDLFTNYFDLLQKEIYMNLYPNPSNMTINFEIMLPNNRDEFELVIHDTNGNELKRNYVRGMNENYILDVSQFSAGSYLYSLVGHGRAYQTGKFIITK